MNTLSAAKQESKVAELAQHGFILRFGPSQCIDSGEQVALGVVGIQQCLWALISRNSAKFFIWIPGGIHTDYKRTDVTGVAVEDCDAFDTTDPRLRTDVGELAVKYQLSVFLNQCIDVESDSTKSQVPNPDRDVTNATCRHRRSRFTIIDRKSKTVSEF